MIEIPKDKYPYLWEMSQRSSDRVQRMVMSLVNLGETEEGAMHQLEFDFSRI